MEYAQFLFLGTGASAGIPVVGCNCAVCLSADPHNKRLRPSAFVTIQGKQLLIDSGPDLRYQALHHQLHHIDGVLLTHSHYDHIAGIDELRAYFLRTRQHMPILLAMPTYQELRGRYAYLFKEPSLTSSLSAQLDFHILNEERGKIDFLGVKIRYMSYEQGGMAVMGYRFGALAYLPDIRIYPESIFEDLKELDTLILSALCSKPSRMHFSLEEAAEFAQRVGARQTYLTHMSHAVEHHSVNSQLPEGIVLAYDGLTISF